MTPEPDPRCVMTRSAVPGITPSPGLYEVVKISTTEAPTSRAVPSMAALRSGVEGAVRGGVCAQADETLADRAAMATATPTNLRIVPDMFRPSEAHAASTRGRTGSVILLRAADESGGLSSIPVITFGSASRHLYITKARRPRNLCTTFVTLRVFVASLFRLYVHLKNGVVIRNGDIASKSCADVTTRSVVSRLNQKFVRRNGNEGSPGESRRI